MKTRVGVIGLGGQGQLLLSKFVGFQDKAEIVAVSDVVASVAEETAKKYGFKAWYTDYHQLLRRTDIDAVCICVPNNYHAEVAIAAAETGKHIFLEKPMCASLKEADDVIGAVRKADVKLMIGYNHPFNPMIQNARKLIDDGRLGKVSVVKSEYVRNMSTVSREKFGWRADLKQAGGGVINESGVHRLSLSWYLGGEVGKVTAFTERLLMDIDGEDNAAILLGYKKGGLGIVVCSWVAEFKGPEWEKIEVYGSEGSVVGYGDTRSGIAYSEFSDIHTPEYGRMKSYFPPGHLFKGGFDSYASEVEHFLDCIARDTKPLIDGSAGRAILEITLGAYESAKTQKVVTLPL